MAFFVSLLLLVSLTTALPLPTATDLPPLFLLAGDSTTAKQAPGGGGWGAGFLSLVVAPASGTNYGQNGDTTVTFKQRGNWAKILADAKEAKGKRRVVVTMQFGHNDQKAGKGISVEEYKSNLVKMAGEIKAVGGTPILITPLTRRSFSGSKVQDSLKEQRLATIAAGKSSNTVVLDLNAESQRYVNALGPEKAHKYNLKEGDNTHLNAEGSRVFGRIVADLIVEKVPDLGKWLKKDGGMSGNIKAGRPGK